MDGEKFHPQQFDYAHDPTWRIFRIMAEFVDGFNFISQLKNPVSIFGSARTPKDDPYYIKARELAGRLGSEGFSVITGGGYGIMEAANEGARNANAPSLGLNIQLPTEQRINDYVDKSIAFQYFFVRKVMLSFSSRAYIFFPGGYGTLDEMFEMIELIQTKKIVDMIPVVLFGKKYWESLCHWLNQTVYLENRFVDEKELKIWTITDDIEEAVEIVKKSHQRTTY